MRCLKCADIVVNGGMSIIHIHTVLLPPADETIADVVGKYPELSTLLAAVATLPDMLAMATDPTTAITLLAPTNEAFQQLLISLDLTLADVVGNMDMLASVLSYHKLLEVCHCVYGMLCAPTLPYLFCFAMPRGKAKGLKQTSSLDMPLP